MRQRLSHLICRIDDHEQSKATEADGDGGELLRCVARAKEAAREDHGAWYSECIEEHDRGDVAEAVGLDEQEVCLHVGKGKEQPLPGPRPPAADAPWPARGKLRKHISFGDTSQNSRAAHGQQWACV